MGERVHRDFTCEILSLTSSHPVPISLHEVVVVMVVIVVIVVVAMVVRMVVVIVMGGCDVVCVVGGACGA